MGEERALIDYLCNRSGVTVVEAVLDALSDKMNEAFSSGKVFDMPGVGKVKLVHPDGGHGRTGSKFGGPRGAKRGNLSSYRNPAVTRAISKSGNYGKWGPPLAEEVPSKRKRKMVPKEV